MQEGLAWRGPRALSWGMDKRPDLAAAYDLRSPDDSRRLYADWAATYDADFADAMDYRLPEAVARRFVELGGAGPVLDLGAGTGLVGALLARAELQVDGTDISPEMLAVAARRGAYVRLFEGDMTARLPVPDGAYAGLVSAGTFTNGHVGPDALAEVVRLAAPGGLAVLSVNAVHWRAMGFADAVAGLSGEIEQVETPRVPIYGAGASGDHAQDEAVLLSFRKR